MLQVFHPPLPEPSQEAWAADVLWVQPGAGGLQEGGAWARLDCLCTWGVLGLMSAAWLPALATNTGEAATWVRPGERMVLPGRNTCRVQGTG